MIEIKCHSILQYLQITRLFLSKSGAYREQFYSVNKEAPGRPLCLWSVGKLLSFCELVTSQTNYSLKVSAAATVRRGMRVFAVVQRHLLVGWNRGP